VRLKPSEKETQKAILELLAAERVYAMRLNTGTAFIEGRRVQAHSGGAGVADILAFPRVTAKFFRDCGLEVPLAEMFERVELPIPAVLWIEVKTPDGKQSLHQHMFQHHAESLGMFYLLARSVDDVANWLRGHR